MNFKIQFKSSFRFKLKIQFNSKVHFDSNWKFNSIQKFISIQIHNSIQFKSSFRFKLKIQFNSKIHLDSNWKFNSIQKFISIQIYNSIQFKNSFRFKFKNQINSMFTQIIQIHELNRNIQLNWIKFCPSLFWALIAVRTRFYRMDRPKFDKLKLKWLTLFVYYYRPGKVCNPKTDPHTIKASVENRHLLGCSI